MTRNERYGCTGKVTYRSFAEAKYALSRIQRSGGLRHPLLDGREKRQPYRCPDCRLYHVGTKGIKSANVRRAAKRSPRPPARADEKAADYDPD